jgi:hypothetical protein
MIGRKIAAKVLRFGLIFWLSGQRIEHMNNKYVMVYYINNMG